MSHPYTSLLLIPTGIGARIGGFAGDALPVARTLAAAAERVITHPNVLNGASLFWPMGNVLYVEGYGLDQFCACGICGQCAKTVLGWCWMPGSPLICNNATCR